MRRVCEWVLANVSHWQSLQRTESKNPNSGYGKREREKKENKEKANGLSMLNINGDSIEMIVEGSS